ncbi:MULTISPECIES: TrbG/VirB9 family P-type conjugative transfer protein [Iodobacter]|uniref:Toxin co-regulated pilus biosynthesis protein Q n=2 Tax=Iodobacter TaxID=32014 RepID=A0A377Q4E0_9NEIS|nr:MULTISPECIES: TrbG/VirB9 family P-type conjugative transfer protein [Iodobacter]NHQ86754.1 TrbG/VirB9 family P-type conjugative transfer protein [Iodobacter violacea]TCU84628.1 toxin co-regulated pilus biosynthesis protein Q [Iodobacter fluviatilis]STQ90094.1 Type IV secretory pathway, VirB9 components [Iodobacter fluviatilis]
MKKATFAASIMAILFASMATAADISNYEFNYSVNGSRFAKPSQVFNDGGKTFFQFRDPSQITIATVDSEGKTVPLTAQLMKPYLVVDGVYPAYEVQTTGGEQSTVRYSGTRVNIRALASTNTATQKTAITSQPSNQVVGTQSPEMMLAKIDSQLAEIRAKKAGIEAQELQANVDLLAAKEALILQVSSKAAPRKSAADKPAECWKVGQTDRLASTVISNWSRQAGWQEPIWEYPTDVALDGNAEFCGEFESVITQFMDAINPQQKIRVRLYAENKAIRVFSAAN